MRAAQEGHAHALRMLVDFDAEMDIMDNVRFFLDI